MVPLPQIGDEDEGEDTCSDRKQCTGTDNTRRGEGDPHSRIERMGNYFSHSLASDVFNGIWEYAQDRLMYMYCRQHNLPSNWRS